MTERLRRGQFNDLATGIWGLGRKTMGHMIEIAPLPALVKGEIYHEDLCLEPEFEIRKPLPIALEKRPDRIGLTISSFEEYVKDPEFTLYVFKKLVLDMRTRSKTFERGVVLMGSGGRSITPHVNEPAPGARRRRGTQQWRETRDGGGFDHFGPVDADLFLQTIEEVSVAIDSEG